MGTGLDGTLSARHRSFPNVGAGTATTTFFQFQSKSTFSATDSTIRHDHRVAVFDDNFLIGGKPGPNSDSTTEVTGFDGGALSFKYVATDGNPSVFEVDVSPVRLPAGGALMISGFAAFAVLRRRKKVS